MKLRIFALSLASIAALSSSAFAGGKTPAEAIGGNPAFTDQGDWTTNGKVHFSDDGAQRSLNGQGASHANGNSATSLDYYDEFGGTRVEPRGLFSGD